MKALFTLPGKHQFCNIEFMIPWRYHKGGRCNVAAEIAEDGYNTLVYIPAGAAHHCNLSVSGGGLDVEEPQIRIS